MTRPRLIGYLSALGTMLLWTGFVLSSRYSVRAGEGVRLSPWDLGALRFAVSGTVAAGMVAAGWGRGLPIGRSAVLAVFAGLGFALPAYVAFSLAPVAHGAVLLSGTLPFFVALGTWAVFGERWSRVRLLSLALVLAGVGLIGTESYGGTAHPGAWRGDLLFLTAAASWAAYTILARQWQVTPAQSVVSVGVGCAILFLPVWWVAAPSRLADAAWQEVAFQAVYHGVLASIVALVLFTRAVGSIGIARLTTITALTPGIAGVAAVPLLGEAIGPMALTGLALVCVAVAVGVRGRG